METCIVTCRTCGTGNRVSSANEGRPGRCGSCHAPLPPAWFRPQPLTTAGFDDFVSGYPGPVLAEFWAPW